VSVLALALMPAPPPMITTGWDKSNHLLAFGVMTCLGCKAFPQRLTIVQPGLLAYGALIEIMQSFTPNRSAEWLDLLADSLGILLGWMLIRFLANTKHRK
jgi:VanZ family protein